MIRIAVVEDEELYAEQLQNYISKYAEERKKQIKVTWFQDGEDIVSGYKGEYDIILLDIQMRFMDGMTAAEKIRELDSEVVLMFITNMIQYKEGNQHGINRRISIKAYGSGASVTLYLERCAH